MVSVKSFTVYSSDYGEAARYLDHLTATNAGGDHGDDDKRLSVCRTAAG